MNGYISVFSLRQALRTCLERLETDPRDYRFFCLDGDQHVAWVQTEH